VENTEEGESACEEHRRCCSRGYGIDGGMVALAAGTSGASHQEGGNGSPNDFAVGSVTTKLPQFPLLTTQKVRFSAHSGPAGEDPHGYVVVDVPQNPNLGGQTLETKGHVTCLNVRNFPVPGRPDVGQAEIQAELDEPIQFDTMTLTHVVIVALDFGLQGEEAPDDRAFVSLTETPSTSPACEEIAFRIPGEDHGNITIHNATP